MNNSQFPSFAPFFHSNVPTCWRASFDTLPKQTSYSTHLGGSSVDEKIYVLAQYLLIPLRYALQLFAYTIEPLPGANKDCFLRGLITRITSATLLFFLVPLAIGCILPAFPLHFYGHKGRPFISVIENQQARTPAPPAPNQLDMRTYNLGFVYESVGILGDLRPPVERAVEIGQHILAEENPPAVIGFQEGFHSDATRALCDTIKAKYPYIIHSVAPHGFGLCSGFIWACQYPPEEVTFRYFDDLIGPERLSMRGLIGLRLRLGDQQYANVYSTHLQAWQGRDRAEVRRQQLLQIINWIDQDHILDRIRERSRQKVGDFLMGDLNLSLVDSWGDYNDCEQRGYETIRQNFDDPFLLDHNEVTGERTSGRPRFLRAPHVEPTGTWHDGPLANKGILLRIKECWERFVNRFQVGRRYVP